jgi:hypothetical protein
MNCGKLVKDKTDQDSWFSAKPIEVGNLSNIIAGTELWSQATITDGTKFLCCLLFLYISGDREDFIGEYSHSEGQWWILNNQT